MHFPVEPEEADVDVEECASVVGAAEEAGVALVVDSAFGVARVSLVVDSTFEVKGVALVCACSEVEWAALVVGLASSEVEGAALVVGLGSEVAVAVVGAEELDDW